MNFFLGHVELVTSELTVVLVYSGSYI